MEDRSSTLRSRRRDIIQYPYLPSVNGEADEFMAQAMISVKVGIHYDEVYTTGATTSRTTDFT
jgi:hypothetical protein